MCRKTNLFNIQIVKKMISIKGFRLGSRTVQIRLSDNNRHCEEQERRSNLPAYREIASLTHPSDGYPLTMTELNTPSASQTPLLQREIINTPSCLRQSTPFIKRGIYEESMVLDSSLSAQNDRMVQILRQSFRMAT